MSAAFDLTVSRDALVDAFAIAATTVERRVTIPVISNFKLVAGDDRLTITATDLDCEITVAVEAEVRTAGATTAPAFLLQALVRRMAKGGDVVLTATDRTLTAQAGARRGDLPVLPADDFPTLARTDMEEGEVDAPKLLLAMDAVAHAMSTEETRYYLNGIYLDRSEDEPRIVAVDGHQLATVPVPFWSGAVGNIILPRTAFKSYQKVLGEAGASKVTVMASDTGIAFAHDTVEVRTKLVDGNFPDWRRVLPQETDRTFTCGRDAMIDAVEFVMTMMGDKGRAIACEFAADGTVTFSNAKAAEGAATTDLQGGFEGEPVRCATNATYLLNALRSLPEGDIRWHIVDPGTPYRITHTADPESIRTIMPMRV